MEELNMHLEKLLQRPVDCEKKFDEFLEETTKRLEAFLFNSNLDAKNESRTPQQLKKKTKRLPTLADVETDTEVDESIRSETKNSDDNSPVLNTRPQRAAKANIDFKEKSIRTKIRRPTDLNETANTTKTKIKQESIVNDSKTSKKKSQKSKTKSVETSEPMDVDGQSNNKLADESSLVVLTNQDEPATEVLDSENETEKMPPPPVPAMRKNLRITRKISRELCENQQIVDLSKVKQEKESLDLQRKSTNNTPITHAMKKEKLSEKSKKSQENTNSKKKVPMPIKEERQSLPEEQNIDKANENPPTNQNTQQQAKNNSYESVYEDAIPGPENLPQSNVENILEKNELKENKKSEIPESNTINRENSPVATDATFITPATELQATFVTNNDRTQIIDRSKISNGQNVIGDVTFDVPNVQKDVFVVPLPGKPKRGNESLITDDDSENELPLTNFVTKLKLNKKELFNPCVQSPLKKKIEAFEKQAMFSSKINSPIPVRMTRTKTKGKVTNENAETENQIKLIKEPKHITPLIGSKIGKLLTPNQQSNITPNLGILPKKFNSTSKLIGLPKNSNSSSTSSRTPSQSRDNSAEDLKRGYNKFLVEEKKKKRELKQQQAQQAREAKERERAERLQRIMDQREEKAQRKALENEKKRQLEEINRQLKLQEEKIEQQKKLEKQRQMEREMMEIARREREMLENLKIQRSREQMQLKLQQNEKQLQQKQLIKEKRRKNDFEMLNSDDSTDEEDKLSQKRPPIPSWSKTSNRNILMECQSYMPSKLIDSFFSVKPMTADLKEIFPSIDPKYLKRNSSFIWKTPTRYSEMPKY